MKIYRTSNYAKGEDSFSFDIGGFCKKKKRKTCGVHSFENSSLTWKSAGGQTGLIDLV